MEDIKKFLADAIVRSEIGGENWTHVEIDEVSLATVLVEEDIVCGLCDRRIRSGEQYLDVIFHSEKEQDLKDGFCVDLVACRGNIEAKIDERDREIEEIERIVTLPE